MIRSLCCASRLWSRWALCLIAGLLASSGLHDAAFAQPPVPASTAQQAAPPQSETQRPNILFIAVDDLRPELGCYGVPEIKTPNIDRLAASGMLFERAYCQQAVCNPSRASIMTGLRPDTLRVWDLRTDLRTTMPAAVTLPQQLNQHGYHSAAIGKIFHNNIPDPPSWSEEKLYIQGFPFDPDAVYLTEDQLAWLEARKQQLIAAGQDKQRIDRFGLWYLKAAATEAPDCADSDYFDGAQTDVAIAKLGELAGKRQPFFFGVGYYRPHLPFNAPKKYWDLYDPEKIPLARTPHEPEGAPLMAVNTIRELRGYYDFKGVSRDKDPALTEAEARRLKHGYYASVSYVDAQIGRLLDRLDELKLTDNTIVVLWSDHGWKLGEYNSWCKMTNFEIDARVPLIVRAPGIKPGQRCDKLVELVDVYPTLCELAGVPRREELEGTSFAPLLQDPRRAWKPAVFNQFLREGIWVAPDGVEYMGHSIRTDRHRYVRWARWPLGEFAAEELYDHQTDPLETRNLAADPQQANVLQQLRMQLDAGWKAAVPK